MRLLFTLLLIAGLQAQVEEQVLFASNTHDTHTFRIPALITATNGDLIAAIDARRDSGKDLMWERDIDIAIRRSTDNGTTWLPLEIVADFGEGKPASDPSLIVDRDTGTVFLFYNFMDQDAETTYKVGKHKRRGAFRFYVQRSTDHGASWSEAEDITDHLIPPERVGAFHFITSGRGCQLRDSTLLHMICRVGVGAAVFGSRDHGATWFISDTILTPANESKIIELSDGRWMVNARQDKKADCRAIHTSSDHGATWTTEATSPLVDAGCNASILRYSSTADGDDRDRLIFCNAASANARENLTVRISYDEGQTWSAGKVINPGFAAYSSLSVLADGRIGVFYEAAEHKENRFASFSLEWLTDGEDSTPAPR
ncbi:MAG: sialidase family protein [Planctomycetota bacterium]|jgi:sialidase-1